MLQSAFATIWRPGAAVFATAVLFGLVHGNFIRFPETFLMGLFSGVVYLKTGNYWLCVLFQAIANMLGPALWLQAIRWQPLFHPFTAVFFLVVALTLSVAA